MARATTDHRGPEFPALTNAVIEGLRPVFGTGGEVVVFPASGSGGWEAALVNTLSPGDRVLFVETGHFAVTWADVARRFGLQVEVIETDWRRGVDPALVEERLTADPDHTIAALAVVHNETSTGATTNLSAVRNAMDRANHPALLLVDAVSSLGSIDYQHDAWRVDVTVAGSQKGLMLPPGLALLAISEEALAASQLAQLPRSYWDFNVMLAQNEKGYFPYTPATNLLFGLREALAMFQEEGLPAVYARHARHGRAVRAAVRAWGLETQCVVDKEMSDVITAVVMPDGHDADSLRALILERFNMALGTGLGRVKGRVFRIGHIGDINDLMVIATVAGIESGLALAGVPIARGGVDAAMRVLEEQ